MSNKMTSTEPILKTIDRYFELLKERDMEGLKQILSADIRVRYYGPEGALPWIGEFEGMAGFEEFLRIVAAHLDIVEVERIDTIADERKVVIQSRGCWRSKTTNKDIHGNMINIFSVKDGKITGYEVYNDTLAFARGMDLQAVGAAPRRD